MIAALLRRPSGAGEFFADAVRLVCVLSLAATLLHGPVDAALFLLVLLGILVSRGVAMSPVFDGIYGLILLTAAWSSVLDLYDRVSWWDLAVHFAATGVIAATAYLLLARIGAVPLPRPGQGAAVRVAVPLLVLALGLALSVIWELGEWAGYTFLDPGINVGYRDTIGDLAAGGLGALLAGALLGAVAGHRTGSGGQPANAPRLRGLQR